MIATRWAAAALAIVAWSLPVSAQTATRDPAAAEALFERGKALVEQGHTAEACEAFAESQRLDPAGGTLLRLALCHETQGKLASAWVEFTEVLRISREGSGEPAKLQERVRLAREHLASIEPRVPHLTVRVASSSRVDGLAVTANGLPREAATWGVSLPADPGDVEIVASAPSRTTFRTIVHLTEGQQVAVDVPLLAPAPGASSAPAAGSASGGAFAEGSASAATESSSLRPIGIVLGGLGVVALGVGTYFGVHAIGKWNDANASCPGSTCANPAGVSSASDAKSAALVADFTIIGGAVAVAAGVVLYVLGAPSTVAASPAGVAVAF